jgi:ABC-type spermidine/putrescine transport system permease subunit II
VVDATIGSALVAAFTSGWGAAVVGAVAAYLIWRHRDRLMGRTAPMVD